MVTVVLSPRSEQKRQQILQAAGELFCEQGYAISMDAIAVKAQVSKQTVYSHFKTKDELFETCIKAKCSENQLDGRLVDDPRPIREVLCDFAFSFQSMLLTKEAQHTYKTAISQRDSHPQLAKVYLSAGPKATADMLANYIQYFVDKGILNVPIPVHEAAMQLLLMWHGRIVYWSYLGETNGETEEERRTYLNSCVDLFLAGYKVKP